MAIGPTGVGKSALLNSLLCPAKYSNELEDCHFKTDNSAKSVTKNITKIIGPWLGDTGSSVIPPVKVFDTQGLGDSDSSSDAATLEEVVEVINSEPVQAILLVFKATDRFSQHIQKQLRTLEYILGSQQLWNHVITVFTFWGFGDSDVRERINNCVKERKVQFGGDVRRTKNHCENFNFENEKVKETEDSYEKYLGVTKKIPYSFPHPVFNYNIEKEKRIFFTNAMTIYNNAKTMTPLHCDEQCQKRLQIAKRSEGKTPFILGRENQRYEAGEEIYLRCNLYLGLGESKVPGIRWWHNSSILHSRDIQERNIRVKDEIVLDVIKESRLIFPDATFADAGEYSCSSVEDRRVKKSPTVTVTVVTRKYII